MSVKIKRERPDQRRHHRVSAPLYVEVAGHALRASNWSLGGLKLDSYPDPLPAVGEEFTVNVTLPFQGFDVSFEAKADVLRLVEEEHTFALRFIEIGERELELMQHFIEELVRGSMVDVEDTIQRIDVPVTPASLEPDAKKVIKEAPIRRWPVKSIVMSAFYITFGLLVFTYAGVLAYTNFFRMEVQTAVISAPVETVKAHADGYIGWKQFRPGDNVRAGEVIIQLYDNALEREIELADIAVKERKAKLAYLKRRHAAELERLKGYATVEIKNVRQTKIELESLKERLVLGQKNVGRLKTLYEKGYATQLALDQALDEVIKLRKEIADRDVELSSRIELADQNFGKRLYTGRDVVGDAQSLEAEVHLAEHEINLALQRQNSYLNHRDRYAVRSPFDGTILDLPRLDKGNVRRGDVIAIVEQRRNRHVTAYLNQDEVMHVGIGDEVTLFIPALGEQLAGRVMGVDRTSGFVQEQDQKHNPGYTWRGPTDRSAKVTIAFSRPDIVANYNKYRSGLPVVVIFERRSTNSFFSASSEKSNFAM